MEEKTYPIQVTLIKQDMTPFYYLDELSFKDKIKKIYDIYLFNRNEHVHCCEITPSYETHYLRSTYDSEDILSDDELEEIDVFLMEANNGNDNDYYQHCRDVDRFVKENEKLSFVDKVEYESIDEAIEYHNGNHVFY